MVKRIFSGYFAMKGLNVAAQGETLAVLHISGREKESVLMARSAYQPTGSVKVFRLRVTE